MKKIMVLCICGAMFAGGAIAGWKDAVPAKDSSLVVKTAAGESLRIDVLAENLFRVRRSAGGEWTESGMNRYGVLKRDWAAVKFAKSANALSTAAAELTVDAASGDIRLKSLVSRADVAIRSELAGKGYKVRFSLDKGERVYGLGDVSRENIQRRGHSYEIWVKNINSYIPIPMVHTTRGWGVFMNTTWRNVFDVGKTDKDALVCSAPQSELDFYVFAGKGPRELLDIYTELTGRPQLLPAFGYGFTYVTNENIDMFGLLNEARQFRDRGLPCDVIGLEPGWMEVFYDRTTRKEWNKKLFKFPHWAPKGNHTFIGALNRMGFKLSLWLCCAYDLFRYEEQCYAGQARKMGIKPEIPDDITETWQDDRITGENKDPRLNNKMLKVLKAPEGGFKEGDLPWFEHLKKFVDQGAQCFKLDGAYQVTDWNGHPNRKWANGASNEENHNLYPLVYGKQMARGYEDYTKRHSMVYSAGGYAGVQQYVATWAGDTGGGEKPCASLVNLGMSGHANQSCDMGIFNPRSLHFGMLQTWSQQNNWAYWHQPWYQRDEAFANFRNYVKLRYRLLPYIYTAAAEAHRTGFPVVRGLPLAYPEIPEYDECKTTYMFGNDLLVGAFADNVQIPPGTWYEWRSGEKVTGPCARPVPVSPEWGGALYVRAGAAVPTWPGAVCIDGGSKADVDFEFYAGADWTGELYEDDGISLGYRKGKCVRTALSSRETDGASEFSIGKRKGSDSYVPAVHNVSVRLHGFQAPPKSVSFCGKPVEGTWDAASRTFTTQRLKVDANGGTFAFAK
jgi:alpha-glucosidase (family GH31 glycosyl hydrolase)